MEIMTAILQLRHDPIDPFIIEIRPNLNELHAWLPQRGRPARCTGSQQRQTLAKPRRGSPLRVNLEASIAAQTAASENQLKAFNPGSDVNPRSAGHRLGRRKQ
jgi:hypothetical protein